jgi:hypothetical protein
MARPGCHCHIVASGETMDTFPARILVGIRLRGGDEKKIHPRPTFLFS